MTRVLAGSTARPLWRIEDSSFVQSALDPVAQEEPLEIRVASDTVAVTMRTKTSALADAHLAVGFLYAEGVITSLADVGSVAHCGQPGDEGYGNIIDVRPGPGVVLRDDLLLEAHRGTLTTSACGVCGRRSIQALLSRCEALPIHPSDIPLARCLAAADKLPQVQTLFRETGGTHAALALTKDGELVAFAEDVGRHNAVDKVVGQLLYSSGLAGASILLLSGRASFEMVQKAAVARIPVVVSISAASSLAIDLAQALGITLLGFARGGRANLYTHGQRLDESPR